MSSRIWEVQLASNIDASATSTWNAGAGFNPIGNITTKFTGTFDGLGHTISNLFINRPSANDVGLFGRTDTATIANIGLIANNIKGDIFVGGLAGYNNGTITNSYATGNVSGDDYVGGLAGSNKGTITNAYATGNVSGGELVGGFTGSNTGTITNAYATGNVSGIFNVGGLTGSNTGTITNSFWDTQTTGQATSAGVGIGLTTANSFTQANYAGFNFTTDWFMLNGSTRPMLRSEYSTSITNAHQLQLMVMDLTADYTLANNIDMSATQNNASEVWKISNGFVPIGNVFEGTFDGLGHTISNLFINRPAVEYIGLFPRTNGASIQNIGLIANDITGKNLVGSLVGEARNTTITKAYATGTVSGLNRVGGLVGFASVSTITNSYATGAVSADAELGGLIGDTSSVTITNSYATGAVIGSSQKAGGLVGNATSGLTTITNSYATGAVSGLGKLGGLVGHSAGNVINNSFWDTQTTGQTTSANGGTGKTTAQMKDTKTFFDAGWDLDTVWGRDINNVQNNGYLDLRAVKTGFAFNTVVLATLADQAKVYDGTADVTTTFSKANVVESLVFTGNKDVGSYLFTSTLGDYGLTYATGFSSANTEILIANTGSSAITPKSLTLSGITANNKVYDGTRDATTTATLSGVLGGDTVSKSITSTFDTKNVGVGKIVTLDTVTLAGLDSANYSIVAGQTTTADITPSASATPKTTTTIVSATSTISSYIYNQGAASSNPVLQSAPAIVNTSPTGALAIKPVNQPAKLISMAVLKTSQNSPKDKLKTPVYEDSPLTLLDEGIRFPANVDQQFFVPVSAQENEK